MRPSIAERKVKVKLQAEKAWLSLNPPFLESWNGGETWLTERVLYFTKNDWKEFSEQKIEAVTLAVCACKVLDVILYHWARLIEKRKIDSKNGTAIVDGESVVEDLRRAIRPTTKKSMGSDPINDVLLAEAAVRMENLALRKFYNYESVFWNEVKRRNLPQVDVDDWNELFERLVGADAPKKRSGKLLQFNGYSSLNVWLRPVIYRFVIDQFRKSQTRRKIETSIMGNLITKQDPHAILEGKESRSLLVSFAPSAFSRISNQEKEILRLEFVLGKCNKEIAKELKLNAGHISRLRKNAIAHFCEELRNVVTHSQKNAVEFLSNDDDEIFGLFAFDLGDVFTSGSRKDTRMIRKISSSGTAKLTPKVDPRISHLIPDKNRVRGIELTETPLEAFELETNKRSLFICLDARKVEPTKVHEWLGEFQMYLDEQFINGESDLVDPRVVVVVGNEGARNTLVPQWPNHYIIIDEGNDDVSDVFVSQFTLSLSIAFASSSDEPETINKKAVETVDID